MTTRQKLEARMQATIDKMKDPARKGEKLQIISNGVGYLTGVFIEDELIPCKSVKWEIDGADKLSKVTLELMAIPFALEGVIVEITVKSPDSDKLSSE